MQIEVNKGIREAAGKNPTQNSTTRAISALCEDILHDKITIPLYQRDISWSLKQAVSLFNYQLLSKSPISAISFNKIEDSVETCVPQVSFLSRKPINTVLRGTESVVDGQQRLSANFRAYINDPTYEKICLDFIKGKFIIVRKIPSKTQVPVGVLYNKDEEVLKKFIKDNELSFEVGTDLLQVRSKFKNYSYAINFAADLTKEEQLSWFEVLNNAGSKVTGAQLGLSKFRMEDIDIYKEYISSFRNLVLDAGYDFFKPTSTNTSFPVAALNPAYEIAIGQKHLSNYAPFASDQKAKKIAALPIEKMKSVFSTTLNSLKSALDFIADNELESPERIDYITYLAGYFTYHPGEPTDTNKEKVINWYKTADFSKKTNQERRALFNSLISI